MTENLSAFLRVIDPADNATGGGAASSVAGAMAASLVGMVARLSIGKKNMLELDETYQAINERAVELSSALLNGSNADSVAFDGVMQAFRMPKSSEEEKMQRSDAIQRAMIQATEVPMQNAEMCAEVLREANSLVGRSNANAASDLDCAVFLATAGLKGALSNAEINISGLKDRAVAEAFLSRVDALRERVNYRT